VLCLSRGEASTLHGVPGDLHRLRADELAAAVPDPPVGSADQNSTHSTEGAHPWTS